MPTELCIFGNCRRIASVLFQYSLTECFRASLRSIQHMKTRFRLYQRDKSKPQGERVFYSFDNDTKKQKSLGTRDRKEAVRLIAALNEANQQPSINRQIAVGYHRGPESSVNAGRGVTCWRATGGRPSIAPAIAMSPFNPSAMAVTYVKIPAGLGS